MFKKCITKLHFHVVTVKVRDAKTDKTNQTEGKANQQKFFKLYCHEVPSVVSVTFIQYLRG